MDFFNTSEQGHCNCCCALLGDLQRFDNDLLSQTRRLCHSCQIVESQHDSKREDRLQRTKVGGLCISAACTYTICTFRAPVENPDLGRPNDRGLSSLWQGAW